MNKIRSGTTEIVNAKWDIYIISAASGRNLCRLCLSESDCETICNLLHLVLIWYFLYLYCKYSKNRLTASDVVFLSFIAIPKFL